MITKTILLLISAWWLVGCGGDPSLASEQNVTTSKYSHDTSLSTPTDEEYAAYLASHQDSPQVPNMIISLIRSHMMAHEYRLAQFYCDEYRREYPSGRRRDEVEYLSIKAWYLDNQEHFDDAKARQIRAQAKSFEAIFGRSPYKTKVEQIITNLLNESNARYERLAKEYENRGKPKAAAYYRSKISRSAKGILK